MKASCLYVSMDQRDVKRFRWNLVWVEWGRQLTQHGCLPSLLGVGPKSIEIVCGEEKKYFVLGRVQNKNLFYRHDKPTEPTKKGPLSFVLFESPLTSVSIRQQRPPLDSLVSLVAPNEPCVPFLNQLIRSGLRWLTIYDKEFIDRRVKIRHIFMSL